MLWRCGAACNGAQPSCWKCEDGMMHAGISWHGCIACQCFVIDVQHGMSASWHPCCVNVGCECQNRRNVSVCGGTQCVPVCANCGCVLPLAPVVSPRPGMHRRASFSYLHVHHAILIGCTIFSPSPTYSTPLEVLLGGALAIFFFSALCSMCFKQLLGLQGCVHAFNGSRRT